MTTPTPEPTYTHDQVSRAANDGASLVQNDPDIYLSNRDHDVINVVVNTIMSLLTEPGMTLSDVLRANWDYLTPDPDDDESSLDPAEYVRGWLQ